MPLERDQNSNQGAQAAPCQVLVDRGEQLNLTLGLQLQLGWQRRRLVEVRQRKLHHRIVVHHYVPRRKFPVRLPADLPPARHRCCCCSTPLRGSLFGVKARQRDVLDAGLQAGELWGGGGERRRDSPKGVDGLEELVAVERERLAFEKVGEGVQLGGRQRDVLETGLGPRLGEIDLHGDNGWE